MGRGAPLSIIPISYLFLSFEKSHFLKALFPLVVSSSSATPCYMHIPQTWLLTLSGLHAAAPDRIPPQKYHIGTKLSFLRKQAAAFFFPILHSDQGSFSNELSAVLPQSDPRFSLLSQEVCYKLSFPHPSSLLEISSESLSPLACPPPCQRLTISGINAPLTCRVGTCFL